MNSTSDDYEGRKARFFRMEEAAKKARSRTTNNSSLNAEATTSTTTATTITPFALSLNSGNSSSNNNNNITSFTSGAASTSTSSKRKSSSQQQRDYPSASKKPALVKPMIDLNLTLAPPSDSLEEANASLVALQQQQQQQHCPSVSNPDNVEQRGVSEKVVSANNNNNNDNDGNNLGWTIKKKLKNSDVKKQQNRLLIESENVNHIKDHLSKEDMEKMENGGFPVKVHDSDKNLDFELKFTFWKSSGCFVLNGKWTTGFVERRDLQPDDKIGLRWESEQNRLVFSVLSRADPKEQKPTQGQVDLK